MSLDNRNDLNETGHDDTEGLLSPSRSGDQGKKSGRNAGARFNISRSNSSSSENNEEISWGVAMNRQTFIGRIRKCGSLKPLEVFLFVSTTMAVLAGVYFNTMVFIEGSSKDVVFSILIILDSIFILFYLTHGIFTEAFFELMALSFSLVLISILFIVNYFMPDQNNAVLATTDYYSMIAFILLTIVSVIVSTILAWEYWTTGNLIFRIVGGDMKYQRMCRLLLLAQSMLAFDAQWTLNNLILVFQEGVTYISNEQQLLLCTGLVLVGLWLFIGYIAMRLESMYLTWIFFGTSLFQPIYILYLFVESIISGQATWNILNAAMYIAGTVLLLTHFSLLAIFASVVFNFNKGLSQKVYGTSAPLWNPASTNTVPADNASESERAPLLSNQPGSSRSGRQTYSTLRQEEDPDAIYPAP